MTHCINQIAKNTKYFDKPLAVSDSKIKRCAMLIKNIRSNTPGTKTNKLKELKLIEQNTMAGNQVNI
jgi:hypothetical protein